MAQPQHPILEGRQSRAVSLRVILADAFAAQDMDLVIHQLVSRSEGRLDRYAEDRDLLLQTVSDMIMHEFDLTPPTPRDPGLPGTGSGANAQSWIRTFYGGDFIGLRDGDQWWDHGQ